MGQQYLKARLKVSVQERMYFEINYNKPRLKSRDITLLTKVHTDKAMVFPIAMNGFPDSSVGKESTCNAGDPSLIPGSGRSPGEGLGYLRQYSWTSLVVQLVKNPPAMREAWVQSLGWEDTLEKGTVTHSSILAWRIP